MGCDIHAIVQVKQPDGNWKTAEFDHPDYGKVGYSWVEEPKTKDFSDLLGRSYDLFAILADVRNGRGFAGSDTGDGFDSISARRGLPEDFEQDRFFDEDGPCSESYDGVWLGDHSHTWITLDEFLNFDWSKTTKKRGWINACEYRRMLAAGDKWPNSWSGGVFGGNIKKVPIDELKTLAVGETDGEPLRTIYSVYEWEVTYREAVWDGYWDAFMALKELGDPKDVRIVMGFDS